MYIIYLMQGSVKNDVCPSNMYIIHEVYTSFPLLPLAGGMGEKESKSYIDFMDFSSAFFHPVICLLHKKLLLPIRHKNNDKKKTKSQSDGCFFIVASRKKKLQFLSYFISAFLPSRKHECSMPSGDVCLNSRNAYNSRKMSWLQSFTKHRVGMHLFFKSSLNTKK